MVYINKYIFVMQKKPPFKFLRISSYVYFNGLLTTHLVETQSNQLWCIELTRTYLLQAKKSEDFHPILSNPWVYFLWTREGKIYVGETENFKQRFQEHLKVGHYFEKIYCYTSVDNRLNKAHIKNLEYDSYELLKKFDVQLLNKNIPTQAQMDYDDRVYVQECFEAIRDSLFHFNLLPLIPNLGDERQDKKINEAIKGAWTLPQFNYKQQAFIEFDNGEIQLLTGSKITKPIKIIEKMIDWNLQTLQPLFFENMISVNNVVMGSPYHNIKEWFDEDWKSLQEYLFW